MKDINGVDVKDGDFCSFWDADQLRLNLWRGRMNPTTLLAAEVLMI